MQFGAAVPAVPTFGLIVPGRPMQTNFQQIDANKFTTVLPSPSTANELIAMILVPAIPAEHSIGVYYQDVTSQWIFIG